MELGSIVEALDVGEDISLGLGFGCCIGDDERARSSWGKINQRQHDDKRCLSATVQRYGPSLGETEAVGA